jgi:hypothetical protein
MHTPRPVWSKTVLTPLKWDVCITPDTVAKSARIFGETLKHEAIDDSDNLSRATEVA